jgi:ABC-2 type transport system ATP-binding protein
VAVEQPMIAIEATGLAKSYGEVAAVRGIDLRVDEGEIFGLIGPDGAGKTSTFQILAGVMEPTAGSVAIFGRRPRDAREETGYLTQSFSLYPDLSVMENIRYTGALRRVPDDRIRTRARQYLRLFDMDRFENRLAGRLSGGMKQKLALACALVAQPRVLLLDEPTTGVDPVSRREFWDVLVHLAADGLTVLVATPYLDEAERCGRVALMHLGDLQKIGTPAHLRGSLDAHRLELQTPDLEAAERAFGPVTGPGHAILDVQRFGDRLDLLVRDLEQGRAALEHTMRTADLRVTDVRADEPTLENAFVATLRGLSHAAPQAPFPARHAHHALRGQAALAARALTKEFGAFTAVKDVTIDIRHGEIYGLLGANGAGKTTVIKILCGLMAPTRGHVEVAGGRSEIRAAAVRQRIGYMSQRFSLYDDLTIAENLDFFAGVYGVPRPEVTEKRRWVLSFSGLEGKESLLTAGLPGGWKQRVAFGAAIMHEPEILVLDEPTSGVDPLARRAFWRMINTLADAGTAILVTTHYLEEAEQCNRLGLMVAGELVAEDSPDGIKRAQHGALLEFVVDQPQRAADLLRTTLDPWRISLFGNRLHVVVDGDPDHARHGTTEQLIAHGIQVQRSRRAPFSLDDIFISVVEERRRRGAAVEVEA